MYKNCNKISKWTAVREINTRENYMGLMHKILYKGNYKKRNDIYFHLLLFIIVRASNPIKFYIDVERNRRNDECLCKS